MIEMTIRGYILFIPFLLVALSGSVSGSVPVLRGAGVCRSPVRFWDGPAASKNSPTLLSQMILVELYPGLATVRTAVSLGNKGTNGMKIRMGLPKFGTANHEKISLMTIDSLYDLNVIWDNRPVNVSQININFNETEFSQALPESYRGSVCDWYIWEIEVPPLSEKNLYTAMP